MEAELGTYVIDTASTHVRTTVVASDWRKKCSHSSSLETSIVSEP